MRAMRPSSSRSNTRASGVSVPSTVSVNSATAVLPVPRANATPPKQVQPADVNQIFLADCAICHGADGRGTNRGPTLVGVGRASLDYYLTTGRMPITDPNCFLANPDQEIERHKPYYSPDVITALEDHVEGLTGD